MQVLPRIVPPEPRAGTVVRRRLLQRLDHVVDAGIGLVSAAGGYGKTTLLASWVASLRPSVDTLWLTLEPEHEDPRVLAEHLATALEPVCATTATADLSDVLTSLAMESDRRQRRIVLVLDDTHRIGSAKVFAAFTRLLERRPARLHIVVSGREDPPLPWDTLRARGELVEIRTPDLGFDAAEARAVFAQTFVVALPDDRVERLRRHTQGWITGLCLAGLALQRTDDPEGMLDARPDHLRHIAAYYEQQVINRLPRDIVTFLEHTAVLDELDPQLCGHLTGRADALDVLDDLVARNLFTERTAHDPPRFRYHDLLTARLRARLHERDPDQVAALLGSAGRWHEQRGQIGTAVELAMRGGDVDRATQLIRSACGPMMNAGYAETVVRWLAGLPDEVVWHQLDLLLVLGRASGLCGDLATAETALLAASKAIASMDQPAPVGLRIGLLQLEGSARAWAGELASAIEPLERAAALFDAHGDDPLLRRFDIDGESLQAGLALTRLFVGQFDEAIRLSGDVLVPANIARPTRFTVLAVGVRALACAWSGDEDAARRAVRQGMRVLQAFRGPGQDSMVLHVARAWLGDDPDADHGLAAASAIAHRLRYPFVMAPTLLASARLHLVRGAPVRARRALAAADDVIAGMSESLVFATIADRLRGQLAPVEPDDADAALNERELEVLAAVARGVTRKQAAAQLHLSINTVKTHLRTAYRKLGANDLDEAVAVARDLGLLDVAAPGDDVTPEGEPVTPVADAVR